MELPYDDNRENERKARLDRIAHGRPMITDLPITAADRYKIARMQEGDEDEAPAPSEAHPEAHVLDARDLSPTDRTEAERLLETLNNPDADFAKRREAKRRLQDLHAKAIDNPWREDRDIPGFQWLADIPADPPLPLLIDRLPPGEHTILFGTGNVGKGLTASWWIAQLIDNGHRVLIVDYEGNSGEWSRRIQGLHPTAIPDGSIGYFGPSSSEYREGGTKQLLPLWDIASDIVTLITRNQFDIVVIDSIVFACGSIDASSGNTEVVAKYSTAVLLMREAGATVLSLAHVTKALDSKYPFGSVMWHNAARFTWSLTTQPDGESTMLTPRKHNNYKRPSSVIQRATWYNDAPVSFQEQTYSASYHDLIVQHLDGAMTTRELLAAMNDALDDDEAKYNEKTIQKTLQRYSKGPNPEFKTDNGRWMLIDYDPPPEQQTLDGTPATASLGGRRTPTDRQRGARETHQ